MRLLKQLREFREVFRYGRIHACANDEILWGCGGVYYDGPIYYIHLGYFSISLSYD